MENRKSSNIFLTGQVLSSKMDKTVTVNVERIFQHPVYKKVVKKKRKYIAHDESNKCKPGDIVKIMLVRPLSKQKRWLVSELISSAPEEVREVKK